MHKRIHKTYKPTTTFSVAAREVSNGNSPRLLSKAMIDDTSGPTEYRILQADGNYTLVGRAKSNRKWTFLDDPLGRALMRGLVEGQEYGALRRYATHWTAGGLSGALQSVDLDRVYAVDFSGGGLAKTEAQQDHRDAYHAAKSAIGHRPSLVADHVACYGHSLTDVGHILGYQSAAHGRNAALELLREAGYRLVEFWDKR